MKNTILDLQNNVNYFSLVFQSLLDQMDDLKKLFIWQIFETKKDQTIQIDDILFTPTNEIYIVYSDVNSHYNWSCNFETFIKKIKK